MTLFAHKVPGKRSKYFCAPHIYVCVNVCVCVLSDKNLFIPDDKRPTVKEKQNFAQIQGQKKIE